MNYYSDSSISSFKEQILKTGDTSAYYSLSIAYLEYSPERLLFWALLMANKYKYPQAYFDVYLSLKYSFRIGIENYDFSIMDSTTKNMAFYYLELGVQKGVNEARIERQKIKGQY